MKNYLHYTLAVSMLVQSAGIAPLAIAQTNPNVAVVGGVGGGDTSMLSPGEYNAQINKTNTDFSAAMEQIIRGHQNLQKEDREYLQSKGKMIADSLRSLVDKNQALTAMSQERFTKPRGSDMKVFLGLINDYNTAVEKVRLDIQEASLISSDTLPSNTASVGGIAINTGAASTIDMTKAMLPFATQLETMVASVNALDFKIGANGGFKDITEDALTPDLTGIPPMDEEEVKRALLEIQMKSQLSPGSQRLQQQLADLTVQQVKRYVQLVGTEESFRKRTQNDVTFAEESYRTIERAFFIRSYLRKKSGIAIGALQPKSYEKKKLHLEIFSKDNLLPIQNALNSIINQTARADVDLMTAYNNAREFVEMYDRSLTPILSKEASAKREEVKKAAYASNPDLQKQGFWKNVAFQAKLKKDQLLTSFASKNEIQMSKPVLLNDEQKNVAYNAEDTGLYARLSGLKTFITGQTSTMEALLAVMRLVLSDIREEIMLSQGDYSALTSYHDQRYYASTEGANRSIKIICDSDTSLTPNARSRMAALTVGADGKPAVACAARPGGLLGNVQAPAGGNVNTTVNQLIESYNKVDMKRQQDVRALRALVDQSLGAMAQEGDQADELQGVGTVPAPKKGGGSI